ncbi:MAG: universal stress protein [Burkholderiaceae bacterium]
MTPIRSILMHADATTPWVQQLGFAAAVAGMFEADLTTLYAAESVWAEHPLAMVESPEANAILRGVEERRLRRARADYDLAAAAIGGRLHWEEAGKRSPERAVTRRALTADLMILGQRPPVSAKEGGAGRHFVESVVMDSGRPAVVVPYISATAKADVVLVAWKDTRESARALTAAIPFLLRARRVHVATWSEPGSDAPEVDVLGYLRLHGIEATVQAHGAAPSQVGEAMLSLAADLSTDLLVMGCYGHSRARERVLGGATRSILETMTLPVLMAH